jgi:hypothetical protein
MFCSLRVIFEVGNLICFVDSELFTNTRDLLVFVIRINVD